MPTGCVGFARFYGTAAIYTQRLLLLYRHEYHTLRCMAFSMSTGCIGFVKYCGKMYSCHLYTTAVVTVQG